MIDQALPKRMKNNEKIQINAVRINIEQKKRRKVF